MAGDTKDKSTDSSRSKSTCDITYLEDFDIIDKTDFTRVFIANMDNIFRFNCADVQKQLDQEDTAIIQELRKHLLDTFQGEFSQFKDKLPINRLVKHKQVADIFHLGFSIVNKTPTKDAERIFKESGATGSSVTDASDLADIFNMFADLTARVITMEKELKLQKADNEQLRRQIAALIDSNKADIEQLRRQIAALVDSNNADNEQLRRQIELH